MAYTPPLRWSHVLDVPFLGGRLDGQRGTIAYNGVTPPPRIWAQGESYTYYVSRSGVVYYIQDNDLATLIDIIERNLLRSYDVIIEEW